MKREHIFFAASFAFSLWKTLRRVVGFDMM